MYALIDINKHRRKKLEVCIVCRAGLRGRQSRQLPRGPGFRGGPNAKK